ncbi:MAG TPA: pre-peptidase C-terminal domain-containing protein, partial [Pirellulales bacterium]|nr:pre-peptidase C-terminal domain-containing protein [Pirellulales bacterium]
MLVAVVVCYGPSTVEAQPGLPVARLTSVFPPGGQRGTTFDVAILGVDLDEARQLQFSDPAISAVPKTVPPGLGQSGPQPVPSQFVVTIKPEAKSGVCDVRAVGKYGISTPRAFAVGTLREFTEAEPNNTLAKAMPIEVNSTVNGRAGGAADQDYFKFTAKKGQRLTLDCWAYRIDSRMDATLVLFDAAGAEVARNRDTNRFDPLLDVVIPADGDYYALVYDFLYGGSNDHFYRLTISSAPYIDFVLPPAGQAGTAGKFMLYGCNLPGGKPSPVLVGGKPLEMLEVQIQLPSGGAANDLAWTGGIEPDESGLDGIEYHLDSPLGPSNSVLIGIAVAPVVAEQEPNDTPDKAQRIAVPCEIYGQFNPRRDQDWFTFEAKQGDIFWIEVFSERLAEPTDPFLLVQHVTTSAAGKEEVKELQAMDDLAQGPKGQTALDVTTEDPAYRYVAPANGMVRVLVRNLYYTATGDPRHLYRLAIHRPQPDFRLVAVPRSTPGNTVAAQAKPDVESPVLRRGGAQ